MDLPTAHRIPLAWLLEHGSEAIRYRTLTELAPTGYSTPEPFAEASQAAGAAKQVAAIFKKQKETGIWGGNLMALAPSVKDGVKEVGTIPQYRRLLQIWVAP